MWRRFKGKINAHQRPIYGIFHLSFFFHLTGMLFVNDHPVTLLFITKLKPNLIFYNEKNLFVLPFFSSIDLAGTVYLLEGTIGTLSCYEKEIKSSRFRFRWSHNSEVKTARSRQSRLMFIAEASSAGDYKCALEYEVDPLFGIWTSPLLKSSPVAVKVESMSASLP